MATELQPPQPPPPPPPRKKSREANNGYIFPTDLGFPTELCFIQGVERGGLGLSDPPIRGHPPTHPNHKNFPAKKNEILLRLARHLEEGVGHVPWKPPTPTSCTQWPNGVKKTQIGRKVRFAWDISSL